MIPSHLDGQVFILSHFHSKFQNTLEFRIHFCETKKTTKNISYTRWGFVVNAELLVLLLVEPCNDAYRGQKVAVMDDFLDPCKNEECTY